MKSFPTQFDIARECGVSRSTVAAVLSHRQTTAAIGEDTRNRIMDAVVRLGYKPNAAGRSLSTGRKFAVALAVPDYKIVGRYIQGRIFQGIGEEAQSHGYAVTVCAYGENGDFTHAFQGFLRESRFDGIFIYGNQKVGGDPREELLAEAKIPYVMLESPSTMSSSLDFDHVSGGRQATEHLVKLGRKRIAFVGDYENAIPFMGRRKGYEEALNTAGLSVDQSLICPHLANFEATAKKAVNRLLGNNIEFDAVFCASDNIAMTMIQAFAERGLKVPGDVSIVGYDDSSMAALANPSLTSVHQDGVLMGRQAMKILCEMFVGKRKKQTLILPVQLVVRNSCGA